MRKRILSFILVLVMMLTMLPVMETEAKAASYDANAAVAYAAAHALDTPEISGADCANFVSKCVTAGGIPVNKVVCIDLRKALEPYGTVADLEIVMNYNITSNYAFVPTSGKNASILSKGDIMFVCCKACRAEGNNYERHVVMYSGESNRNGYALCYAHTSVANNTLFYVGYKNGYACSNGHDLSQIAAEVVHFNTASTLHFRIEAYPLSYGNISVYNAPNGEKLSNRYITGSTDLCKILETSDKWFYVSYPSSAEADGWFEAWVPVSEFTPLQSGKKWITEKSYTMYRRSDKKEVFDTIPAGFEVLETGIDGNMVQVAYQPGNYKRMGWIEVHSHNYSKTVKAPTCTEQGYTTYTCSCGDSYKDDYTEATGHKPTTLAGKDPTCTEAGLTLGSKCSACGKILSEQKKLPALGHTTELKNVKSATCTTDGYTGDYVCKTCDKTIKSGTVIKALGHKWNSGKVTTEATCEKDGVKTYTCQNDKAHTKTETIKATGHSSVNIKGKAATCTKDGLSDGSKCSNCGKVLKAQTTIPATGHTVVTDKAVAATCTAAGKTEGKHCSVCNTVIVKQETVPALGHSNGAPVKENSAAATCDKDGSYDEAVYCTVCKAEISRTKKSIPATGHKDTDKNYKCDACGAALCTDHKVETIKGKAATCTKDGLSDGSKCSNCGKVLKAQTTIPATGHTVVTDKAVAATCTAAGKTEGKHCSVCNTVIVKQESVPAKGHSFSGGKCTVCGTADPNHKESSSNNPFTDVTESDWFCAAVLWAVEQGITGGTSATTFSPNNPCTREQVVTFLWAAAGKPEPTTTKNPFTDVSANDWFYKPVLWAVENGITGGTSATTFGTGQTCTRAQVAVFLYASKGKPAFTAAGNPFTDVSSGDWFYNAVMWAVENDITGGIGNGKFGPNNFCTRGQIALFLYKAEQVISNSNPQPDSIDNFATVIKNIQAQIGYDTYSQSYKNYCHGCYLDLDGRNFLVLRYFASSDSPLTPGHYVSLWVQNKDGSVSCLTNHLMDETTSPDNGFQSVFIRKINGEAYLNTYVRKFDNNVDTDHEYLYLIAEELEEIYYFYSEVPIKSMQDGMLQHDESKAVYYLNQTKIERNKFHSMKDELLYNNIVIALSSSLTEPSYGFSFEKLLAQS